MGSSFELNTGVFICHLLPPPGQPAEQDPNSGSPGHRGDSWGGILSQHFPPRVSALTSSDLSRSFPFVLTQQCVLKGVCVLGCVFAFNILFSTSVFQSGGGSWYQPATHAGTKSKSEHLYNRL